MRLMVTNNSRSMSCMFYIPYKLICFIVLIKLLFCNIFIEFFFFIVDQLF